MTVAKNALSHGGSLGSHFHASFVVLFVGGFPLVPEGSGTLAIESAFSGDGDVFLFEGVYERRIIHHLGGFESPQDDRQKVFWVGGEADGCLLDDVKAATTLEDSSPLLSFFCCSRH